MEPLKNFICTIDKNHLLNEAKSLPCGGLACAKCVDSLILENGNLSCPHCNKPHSVYSSRELPSKLIKWQENSESITKELMDKMKQKIKNLEGNSKL